MTEPGYQVGSDSVVFFNRIDTETAGSAVTEKNNFIVMIATDIAKTPLPLFKLALMGANITLYALVIKSMLVLGRMKWF
ncbi:hypothetical protein GCM10007941_36330 [Amphritea balenae]|nr:hypothetical protein GCM10007941_36330 [Amphritea balenae]